MPQIQVRFKEPRSAGYTVVLQAGLLSKAGAVLGRGFAGHKVFLISSQTVHGLYGRSLEASLKKAGMLGERILLPDGEENKNFKRFSEVLNALAAFGRGRQAKPLVVLLGGGVIGDLGGFVAACYKRGVPFVQIPTTLLSMVDSSVGGKLGVDFETPQGLIKNLVGAFYQPEQVLVDPALLKSLPAREVRSGFGEVVKTALLFDAPLFSLLEKRVRDLLALQPSLMADVIARCLKHKAALVGRDEFDRKGDRMLLNLGHTFGHAIETASGFKLRHGEAVAVGLACACDLSVALGLAKPAELSRVEALLGRLGLATRLTGLSLGQVMKAMSQDKKFDGGMRFVLPRRIGAARLVRVAAESKVREVLESRIV